MQDCIFCKIVRGEIPSQKVYEDDRILAFNDINPLAPVHILIIPKEHITNVLDVDFANDDIVSHIHKVAVELARKKEIAEKGFRIVTNSNEEGGQIIFHMHYHLIGGETLKNFA